jgi:hypothetical protein
MADGGKVRLYIIAGFSALMVYALVAARPVSEETVFSLAWMKSLESSYAEDRSRFDGEAAATLIPLEFGRRFGFVNHAGRFSVLGMKQGYVSMDSERYAHYENLPKDIDVYSPLNVKLLSVRDSRGYPLFIDKRMFIVSFEQNSLTHIDNAGAVLWKYDFFSPITCIDGASGYIAVGLLDGSIDLITGAGERAFSFEPGGSRVSVITGIALTRDARRIAVISGIDEQRFLLLENVQDTFRVIYHEFLGAGFRKAVYVRFIDNERHVAFEREGALGIYDINTRVSSMVPVEGTILALEEAAGNHLFVITGQSNNGKKLYMLQDSGTIAVQARFKANDIFLSSAGTRVYIGGGTTLAAFDLERR